MSWSLRRPRQAVALAVVTVAICSGCAFSPTDLPNAKGGVGPSYSLTIDFANALNLPADADVIADGARVGEVTSVRRARTSVEVGVRIRNGTRIGRDATVAIRQTTVLGDTYLQIEQPSSPGGPAVSYGPGDTIPAERTVSPPQLEDTLAVLATFVNGGTIGRLVDAMQRFNRVIPTLPRVQKLAGTVSVDLRDLGTNTVQIDRFLDSISATGASINANGAQISEMLNPDSMIYWRKYNENILKYIGTLLPSIGSIFQGGFWLVPFLNSAAAAVVTVRSTGEDVISDVDRLGRFLHETVLPFMRDPNVDVLSVSSSQDARLTTDATTVLRMLGAVR